MESVWSVIEGRAAEFVKHPLLQRLERKGSIENLAAFSPGLTFWVGAFQDTLRIIDQAVTDPLAKQISTDILDGDGGHDAWFFHDLTVLGRTPALTWVFGEEHAVTRDAVYQLVSEVHRASSDMVRIALLLVLETTGHAFFERVAPYVERTGYRGNLKYFHKSHLEAEEDHSLWEQLGDLRAVTLDDAVRAECVAMIDRSFDAFVRILAHCEHLAQSSAVPPQPAKRASSGSQQESLD